MPFANKLSKLRKEKGLTQQEMAQKIQIGIAQIKRYESGKCSPTLEVIKNIAKTLGISADELIFDKDERIPTIKIFDRKLLEQFELISTMNFHDQYAIKIILEGMIVKSRLNEIMPSDNDSTWSKEMRSVVTEFRKGAEEYTDDEIDNIVDEAVKAVRKGETHRSEKVGS